jgi:hypothetical protein
MRPSRPFDDGRSMRGQGRDSGTGAWLAIVAMLVQILLPVLAGFEMSGAARARAGADGLCPLHEAAASDAPDAAAAAHHRAASGPSDEAPSGNGLAPCCPLCTALHAGQPFVGPADVLLPAPHVRGATDMAAAGEPAVAATYAASYSSRAPPPIG